MDRRSVAPRAHGRSLREARLRRGKRRAIARSPHLPLRMQPPKHPASKHPASKHPAPNARVRTEARGPVLRRVRVVVASVAHGPKVIAAATSLAAMTAGVTSPVKVVVDVRLGAKGPATIGVRAMARVGIRVVASRVSVVGLMASGPHAAEARRGNPMARHRVPVARPVSQEMAPKQISRR